ncbi:MAG: hypothetical protein ACE5JM_17510, partial [Armatimonadota bacterium]
MSDESTHHRVVILYSSIGAGHRIAAEALASAVRTAAPEIAIKTGDAIEIVGSRIALRVPGFYPWFRGRFPWLYDRLWRSKRTAGAFSWLGGRLGGR